MAQKVGTIRKFVLTLILLALIAIVFVLMDGGDLLKTAGKKLEGAGQQADTMKQKIEQTGENTKKTVEKTVEKGIDAVRPGEKK